MTILLDNLLTDLDEAMITLIHRQSRLEDADLKVEKLLEEIQELDSLIADLKSQIAEVKCDI